MKTKKAPRFRPKASTVDVHDNTLQQAITHHQRGDWAEAARLSGQILKSSQKHFDALHFSGLIAYQTGQFHEAERF